MSQDRAITARMPSIRAACIALLLFCLHQLAYTAESVKQKRSDVRVLIDISGSMKKNDPENLRIPALKIITNLMPKGSEAGVWAFGKYVNMLVPIKQVDNQWQANANKAADKINSAGLFTNIGDAMSKSSWDWNKPDDSESRSMILLTDGMVDISKDAAKNQAEREKILNVLLPRLKNAGVTIHTVALSEQADSELLSELSNQTDGWFQSVSNAEDLQRVFLKIFEQATPRDSLPLDNNTFKVDGSVEEMTLLVFREKDSEPTRLIEPTTATLDKNSDKQGLRWFSTNAYDLITIENPQPGDWQVDAAIDPDNRVMVVSKLGLQVSDIPNNVLANEQINYAVKLIEDGQVITKPDFLQLVEAKLETRYKSKTQSTPLLRDDTGTFRQVFFAGEDDGVLEIKLTVKSPTFERSRTHAVNIYGNPVETDLQLSYEENQPHKVHLRVAEDVLDLSSLKVATEITYPDDSSQFITFSDWQSPQVIELKQFPKGGRYKVQLTARGQSPLGRSFSSEMPAVEFETEPLEGFATPEEPVVESPVEEQPVKEPETEPETVEPEVTTPVESEEPAKEDINWTLWLSLGLVGNVALVALGWFGWRILRKKSRSSSEKLAEELFEDDEDNDSPEEDRS